MHFSEVILTVCLDKLRNTSVPAAFDIVRKKTCRDLSLVFMVSYALTTYPLARAGFIAAVTPREILLFFTLHG